MILGVGIDIVDVRRIMRAMDNPRFVKRILTPRERALGSGPEFVAGRWAVKEAVAKALSRSLNWHEVEVLRDALGGPLVTAPIPLGTRLHVSISHERDHAVGLAVWEQTP